MDIDSYIVENKNEEIISFCDGKDTTTRYGESIILVDMNNIIHYSFSSYYKLLTITLKDNSKYTLKNKEFIRKILLYLSNKNTLYNTRSSTSQINSFIQETT